MADSNVVVGFSGKTGPDEIGPNHYERISTGARILRLFLLDLSPRGWRQGESKGQSNNAFERLR